MIKNSTEDSLVSGRTAEQLPAYIFRLHTMPQSLRLPRKKRLKLMQNEQSIIGLLLEREYD